MQTEKRSLNKQISLDESQNEGRDLIEYLFASITAPDAVMERREDRADIDGGVRQLPEDQPTAVRLRHLEGYTLKQLA